MKASKCFCQCCNFKKLPCIQNSNVSDKFLYKNKSEVIDYCVGSRNLAEGNNLRKQKSLTLTLLTVLEPKSFIIPIASVGRLIQNTKNIFLLVNKFSRQFKSLFKGQTKLLLNCLLYVVNRQIWR